MLMIKGQSLMILNVLLAFAQHAIYYEFSNLCLSFSFLIFYIPLYFFPFFVFCFVIFIYVLLLITQCRHLEQLQLLQRIQNFIHFHQGLRMIILYTFITKENRLNGTEKNFMVDNVRCCSSLIIHQSKLETGRRTHPRACHIQLAMSEYLPSQPNSSKPQSLSLGLVDCNGKGWSHWELSTLPFKRIFCWFWDESDSWDKNQTSSLNNSALEQFIIKTLLKYQTSSITQTLPWINVAQQHDWHPSLKI